MTINFFKCIEFVTICLISFLAYNEYGAVIGLAIFSALTNLKDIKEAVQK